jgi:hypothetical protein
MVKNAPSFDDTHKAYYFAYLLVQNPGLVREFLNLLLIYHIIFPS